MSLATQIMVVDDEEAIREALEAWFIKDGYRVDKAESGFEALERMTTQHCDVYFVDIKMPGMDGMELLAKLKEKQPDAAVIMITAHGSIQTAVEAMKLGACDYLCKPFDPDQLSLLMERIMASKALREENQVLKEQLMERRESLWEGFIAQSDAMHQVFSIIEDVAPTPTPVHITGETGVGKELIAEAIHMQSHQSEGPFIAINCGALSETLLESELFGHERGAFTGAVKARRGRLEMANKGTLFLDEIGEISPKMQVSLLRVLEEKTFQRLGGSESISTDFRLLSATHRNLPQLIKEDQFRDDFFYRINVITLEVPPLRERLEDVPALADHFFDLYVQETGKRLEGFTQRALGMLMAYAWPGNVRELRNVIERAVVIARGKIIGAEELTFLDSSSKDCRLGTLTLHEVEISHIRAVLDACNWNVSRTAKQLDIDRSTLNRKIKRFHIEQS
jgi:DNA-binding NtrC family response regulator